MKKLILIIALVFISTTAFAQKRNELQGPKHKNYKPWQHKVKPTLVFTSSAKDELTSLSFKNFKPWQSENATLTLITLSKRPKVIGPKYKNYKPWKNSH